MIWEVGDRFLHQPSWLPKWFIGIALRFLVSEITTQPKNVSVLKPCYGLRRTYFFNFRHCPEYAQNVFSYIYICKKKKNGTTFRTAVTVLIMTATKSLLSTRWRTRRSAWRLFQFAIRARFCIYRPRRAGWTFDDVEKERAQKYKNFGRSRAQKNGRRVRLSVGNYFLFIGRDFVFIYRPVPTHTHNAQPCAPPPPLALVVTFKIIVSLRIKNSTS